MTKLILFDWGGVLAPECNLNMARHFGKKYNINIEQMYLEIDSFDMNFMKGEDDELFFQTLSKDFNINIKELKAVHNQTKPWKVYNIARDLTKQGHNVGILSNQMKTRTNFITENFDIDFFTYKFFSSDIKLKKPDKEIYEYVENKTNLSGEEILFIDDKERNFKFPKQLGWKTYLFTTSKQFEKDMKELIKFKEKKG